jgi:ADP-ribose pyrophosphatase YjhB (NUDIX family)
MVAMNRNKIISQWIDKNTYNTITELIPITCVDLLFIYKGSFLLGKRVNSPGQGEWFYPGGRVYKGELLKDAVIRKAKEELGISIKNSQISFLTVGETIFKGKTIDNNRHSINTVFKVELKNLPKFITDEKQISVLQWFTKVDQDLHPYTKTTLKVAGFK